MVVEGSFTFINIQPGTGAMRFALENAGGRCLYTWSNNKTQDELYLENFQERPDNGALSPRRVPAHDLLASPVPKRFHLAGKTMEPGIEDLCTIIRARKPGGYLLYGAGHIKDSKHLRRRLEGETGYHQYSIPIRENRGINVRHCILVGLRDSKDYIPPEISGIDPQVVKSLGEKTGEPCQMSGHLNQGRGLKSTIDQEGAPPHRLLTRLLGLPETWKTPRHAVHLYWMLRSTPRAQVIEAIARSMVRHFKTGMTRGRELEEQVSGWLERYYGYKTRNRVSFAGAPSMQVWEIDIAGWKETGSLLKKKITLWVECKSRKVSGNKVHRGELLKFIGTAQDVRKHSREKCPDILLFVTDTCFNPNAVRLGDVNGVYMVQIDEQGYRFIGEQGRADFRQHRISQY